MKYRTIPGTPLKPSIIGLGTVLFGSGVSEQDSFRLMDAYLEMGGNFIDTANVYGDWVPGEKSVSEKAIGKWMKRRGNRNRIIIGTKGAHPNLAAMHVPRLSPAHIIHDLDQSLEHLQTDYIDLYWLHRDDPLQPVGEIIEVLNRQISLGKIRAIGCSNWTVNRMEEAQEYAERQGLIGFAGNQSMWSLAIPNVDKMEDRTMVAMDEEGLQYHRKSGMAAFPYTTQAYGFFSGQYRQEVIPGKQLVYNVFYNEENFRRLERVSKAARELSRTNAEIILGYLTSHDFPVFPLIGSRSLGQLRESCLAGDFELDVKIARYLESGE